MYNFLGLSFLKGPLTNYLGRGHSRWDPRSLQYTCSLNNHTQPYSMLMSVHLTVGLWAVGGSQKHTENMQIPQTELQFKSEPIPLMSIFRITHYHDNSHLAVLQIFYITLSILSIRISCLRRVMPIIESIQIRRCN